jgi:hypothetical protein
MSALHPKADIPTLLRNVLVNSPGTKSENSVCEGAPGLAGVTGGVRKPMDGEASRIRTALAHAPV